MKPGAFWALMAVCVISLAAAAQPAFVQQGSASSVPVKKSTTSAASSQTNSTPHRATSHGSSSSSPAHATPAHATSHAQTHAPGSTRTAAGNVARKTSSKGSTGHAAVKGTAVKGKGSTGHKKTTRVRGQQKIDPERAQAIQQALIRENYLSPDSAGQWNQASEDAMRRFQQDHGWQIKEVPDSRALIKLGLGPSKDGLLNPETAMTSAPDAPKSQALPSDSHTSDPASSTTSPNRQ